MMKYIAHRGASKRYIENTYKAFKYAFESSFDGCECDIRITRDHAFIVYHDKDLLRLNNNKQQVKDLNLVDIQQYVYSDGQEMLTLQQLLELQSQFKKNLLIEIKDELTRNEMESLNRILQQVDLKYIKIISFHLYIINYFRQYVDVMYLKNKLSKKEIMNLNKLEIYSVNLNVDYYQNSTHSMYIQSNLYVSYWTVDDVSMQQILQEEKVEFLTTNIVD